MIKTETKKELFTARYFKGDQNGASSGLIPQSTKLLPPFTSLCLLPNEIGFHLMKKQNDLVVADLVKDPSMILIDAGTPKVLSRLYGGFYPDWVTGGLWTNSSSFIGCIANYCKDKKHKLVVAFDSSIDANNLNSWLAKMEWDYENIREVFNIIQATGHPPCSSTKRVAPLWFPPTALQTSMRLICLSLGIKMTCTLYEHEPELVAVPNARHAQSKSLMDEAGVFFTNSLEFLCYTDLNVNNLLWGESLKLNMRGDKMTGKKIDRDDVAGTLGIANESLDAGLLYYGTRYFLDYSDTDKSKTLQEHDQTKKAGRPDFDPTDDLHHEMLAALTPEDLKPERRLKQAVSIMRQVHHDGINKKNSLNVGESLLPSVEHIIRCLKEGTPLPPDFVELSLDDPQEKIEAEISRLRNRAEDAFFEIGSRLIEGRLQTTPDPYFKEGKRNPFPHQMRFTQNFLVHLENYHKSGNMHQWVGQLVFAMEPTIRLPYTMGDRGRVVLKWKEEPKLFFRDLRRRMYGFLFGSGKTPDCASDSIPSLTFVREIDYAGMDVVYPISVSPDISRLFASSEAMWGCKDTLKGLHVLVNLVFGNNVPPGWEQMFSKVPEICWVPIIAVRYMMDRCPSIFVPTDFLDVLLATVASLANSRLSNPGKAVLSDYDRTASDAELIVDANSVSFVSYFMTAVDHVIFANDVVQQVISSTNVNPVQYFDGNVFHTFLELRKRNNSLEGFLGHPERKMEIFLKIRHLVVHEFHHAGLLDLLLYPRTDTTDNLLRKRLITEDILQKPIPHPCRVEQKRGWEAAADSFLPTPNQQRAGMLPSPYGFQPVTAPPLTEMSAPALYVEQVNYKPPPS